MKMPHYNFVVCYEKDVFSIKEWFENQNCQSLVPIDRENIHTELINIKPVAVIFSSIQNRPTPLSLLYKSRKINIPTLAFEESIQMALNDGKVNNYMFPVDYIGFASEFEKRQSLKAGLHTGNIFVTGWPFLHKSGRNSNKKNLRNQLGIEEGKKVISITFPGLYAGTESGIVRNSQLQICASLLKLDINLILVIKPHPVESLEHLNKSIIKNFKQNKNQVKLLGGEVLIDEVIAISDFMLNRGASQTFFEALLNKVPVILVDVGVKNHFYQYSPQCVQKTPEGILQFIRTYKAVDFDSNYSALLEKFLPYSPQESLSNSIELIERAIRFGLVKINNFAEIMFFSFLNLSLDSLANECLLDFDPNNKFLSKYESIISNNKLTISEWQKVFKKWEKTFYYNIVFSVFINSLHDRDHSKPVPKSWIKWIMIFPKEIHPIWFVETLEKVLLLLKEDKNLLKKYLDNISFLTKEGGRFQRLISSYQ